jgi:hypothetical protein
MSSRFNTLYLGPATEAMAQLEKYNELESADPEVNDLRLALINALRRIAWLEDAVVKLARVPGNSSPSKRLSP